MKVCNQYPKHHYITEFDKTSFFCPNCGNKEVWVEGEGDYYVGPTYLCTSCKEKFYLPSETSKCDDREQQIIRQLLCGISDVPKNP